MDAKSPLASSGRANCVAAAVIAGGEGRRMGGIAKGLLMVQGQRIIDRQLALLQPLFSRVFIVANDPQTYADLGVAVVPDRVARVGPLAGIEAALAALQPHEDAVVCVAADLPFLTTTVLTALRDHAPETHAVVPYVQGHPEPLCARYGKAALAEVQAALHEGAYKLMNLLQQLQALPLPQAMLSAQDATGRFATNVNTPEDLAATD